MSEQTPRAQILGKLVREAREYAGRSAADCAVLLQISAEEFAAIENGAQAISLPDLEILALYLGVPMGHFWGNATLVARPHVDYANMVGLRHRMIGIALRQMRLKEKRTIQEVAEATGVSVAQIEAFEGGEQPVPYLLLEEMARFLQAPITGFLDVEHGPLGRHEAELRLLQQFHELPAEMQKFLANPQSLVYLETAFRLSKMDAAQLRQIAESILEITW